MFLSSGRFTLLALTLSFAASAQTLVRPPYLQRGGPDSILVRWRTDVPTDSEVRYGDAPGNLTNVASAAAQTIEHGVALAGLAPDTTYYYSVGAQGLPLAGDDADHFFVTSPAPGTPVDARIWVVGDSGTADANAVAVRDAYLAYPGAADTRLFLMLGDNAYDSGTDAEYTTAVFGMYPMILRQAPVWPTFGNHDDYVANGAAYFTAFDLPTQGELGGIASGTEAYYSFDYGDVHLVCLDSEDNSDVTAMRTWLLNDLAGTAQRWIIAFWHHPPYTKGSHDSDQESQLIEMRTNIVPVLEDYGVDLVLCGHSHSYERSFLIDGHYGFSDEFGPAYQVDGGDGQVLGDGAYSKSDRPHAGAVYVVAGSSGKISGGALDHAAMFVSFNQLGSVVLDVDDGRLDVTFLRSNGATPDHFTILKGPDGSPPGVVGATATSAATVEVLFDEEVDASGAEDTSNYMLDAGMSVQGATLQADGRTVLLDTTVLVPTTPYALTVSGVSDLLGNVLTSQQVGFTWLDLQTLLFRDGIQPSSSYAGTRDATLVEATPNLNQGATALLLLDGDDGGGSDLTSVVRWDIAAVPSGATVHAAELTLNITDASSDAYEVYALLTPWVEADVTWNLASAGTPWQVPGAEGPADRGADVLGTLVASSTGVRRIALNAAGVAVVQGWIDDPSSNHGFVLHDTAASNGIDARSRESGAVTQRPRLEVVFQAPGPPGLGYEYCAALTNSTGQPAAIGAIGSATVGAYDLVLTASDLPPNQFGYFLGSLTQGYVHFPAGSSGDLCLGGNIGRFSAQTQSSGSAGEFSIVVDLTAIPTTPVSVVQPGETWNFQAWFRDVVLVPTSSFTPGLAITFVQ